METGKTTDREISKFSKLKLTISCSTENQTAKYDGCLKNGILLYAVRAVVVEKLGSLTGGAGKDPTSADTTDMGKETKISWATSTFNPWWGCTEVSTGCDNCYSRELDKRYKIGGAVHWGTGVPRYRTSESNWKQPLSWNKKAAANGKPWRVFCASLADVFDNEVPVEWRRDLFSLIEQTPNLSWLLVTKRIGNVFRMVSEARSHDWLSRANVRLLITVVNQEEADRDIPKLLALPCHNGISYEPALGLVDWAEFLPCYCCDGGRRDQRWIDWIIVGGESAQGGHQARPFDLAWARSTIAQCRAAGVPVFCKDRTRSIHRTNFVHGR
jgi:protein gp37